MSTGVTKVRAHLVHQQTTVSHLGYQHVLVAEAHSFVCLFLWPSSQVMIIVLTAKRPLYHAFSFFLASPSSPHLLSESTLSLVMNISRKPITWKQLVDWLVCQEKIISQPFWWFNENTRGPYAWCPSVFCHRNWVSWFDLVLTAAWTRDIWRQHLELLSNFWYFTDYKIHWLFK